jgi:hypothetical protein
MGATLSAEQDVQIEDALHELRPQVAVRRSWGGFGLLRRVRGIPASGAGPGALGQHLVTPRRTWREHAVVGLQLHSRRGHEGGETLEEHEGVELDVRGAVAPGAAELIAHAT